MKTPTIIDAISTVLQESKTPLSIGVIYNKIIEKDYYKFNAQNPQSVVRVELRRHCIGVDFPTAASKKYFQILLDGTYCLINQFVEEKKEATSFLRRVSSMFPSSFIVPDIITVKNINVTE